MSTFHKPAPKTKIPLPMTGSAGPKALALDTFLSLLGQKPDQVAGFRSWARAQGLGLMPQSEWRKAMAQFWAKPVR